MLNSAARFIKFHILHVEDSAHRIALGVGLGFFVAYMPPLGFHIIVVLVLAYILNANRLTALISVWATNPLTFMAIYYPSYLLGRGIVGFFRTKQAIDAEELSAQIGEMFSPAYIALNIFTQDFWRQVWSLLARIGLELTIGGIILGAAFGTLGYLATYYFVRHHRLKKPHRRFRKHA